ncbi:MAG TPA: hypothetical protein DDZ51_02535 [Planctomycetaceae bacterium]|nr:hypothetical protein [Planctomycetaceae bacterium]
MVNLHTERIQTIDLPVGAVRAFLELTKQFPTMQLRRRTVQSALRSSILATLGELLGQQVCNAVLDPDRGAVMLRSNLTIADVDSETVGRLVCGLATLFGTPYSHWNRGSAIFRNQLNAKTPADRTLRRANWPDPLHTDTMNSQGQGEDYCVFGCVRRDHCKGGESQLLHVDDWPNRKRHLDSPFAWENHTMVLGDTALEGQSMRRPIFTKRDDRIEMCWSPRNIRANSRENQKWLDQVRDSLAATPRTFQRTLYPGEILIFDNKRWLHGRSPIESNAKLDRLLLASHVDG